MSRGNFHQLKWLVLALAILSAALGLAFWSVRTHYEYRLAQQIWPTIAPDISARSSSPANSARTVLLLGDSRMEQWGLPSLPGWRVVNAGTGGLTTGQLRLTTAKLLDEFHPDVVVLEAGINDLKYLGLHPEEASGIASFAACNLEAIAYECAGRHCKVIVLETWPVGKPSLARQLVWSAEIPAAVDRLNAQLQSLSWPEDGIHVVDLFKEAGLKPEAGLFRDTLHFQSEVYQQLTPVLKTELEALPPPARD